MEEETTWKDKGVDIIFTLNRSFIEIIKLMNGSLTYPNMEFWAVSLKDVVEAHTLEFYRFMHWKNK